MSKRLQFLALNDDRAYLYFLAVFNKKKAIDLKPDPFYVYPFNNIEPVECYPCSLTGELHRFKYIMESTVSPFDVVLYDPMAKDLLPTTLSNVLRKWILFGEKA